MVVEEYSIYVRMCVCMYVCTKEPPWDTLKKVYSNGSGHLLFFINTVNLRGVGGEVWGVRAEQGILVGILP